MRIILALCMLFVGLASFGQNPSPPSDLSGIELRTWLKNNWYSPWHNDLGYSGAREAMYGTIDDNSGQIECIYTGFSQGSVGPVTFPDPINTEHTVPQSFFDSQLPMRSDIHHLFPTHQDANSSRGSLPFEEVHDSQADVWLIGTGSGISSNSNIPTSNIDDYSETYYNDSFEPREEQKGNTARAVFYFYTMYPFVGDISESGDLNDLFLWHQNDPPDALEIERNQEIQNLQGNYNPYISMPELVGPAWDLVSSLDDWTIEFSAFYQAQANQIIIQSSIQNLRYSLWNIAGQQVMINQIDNKITTHSLSTGLYLLLAQDDQGNQSSVKLMIEK